MNEVDHVQAAVLKDLGKMVIAGAGIIALLALLVWGLVTSAEAAGLVTVRSHSGGCSKGDCSPAQVSGSNQRLESRLGASWLLPYHNGA
jgi:hypothetical protein